MFNNSDATVINTIYWGNTADNSGDQIYMTGSSPSITYCDVQGGWTGTGNIDCDPDFCQPTVNDYDLDAASCCVGGGVSGAVIGALGIGCGQAIPTLSEWGLIILALLLLAGGTVAVIRRCKTVLLSK